MLRYANFILPLMTGMVLSACGSGSSSTAATTGWAWMSGSNASDVHGVYGSLGLAAAGNIPGSRNLAVSWVDNSGNFWLFGGSGLAASGVSGNLNDLWRYTPSTGQWTWMSGANTRNAAGNYGVQNVAAASNVPGARFGEVSWTDKNGNLWLFGGYGEDASAKQGMLNDLWEYLPSNNQWVWVDGESVTASLQVSESNATPSARVGSVGWVDKNGKLWLFGGAKDLLEQLTYNDLWEFNPADGRWRLVSGNNATNNRGIYGVQGVAESINHPGGRLDAVSWLDESNNLWLFGGSGVDAFGVLGDLNDLWQYNVAAGEWTWKSGSNNVNQYGSYGTLGVSTANTIPGARMHRVPIAWVSNQGSFMMFGGDGYAASTKGYLNDLWSYNPANNQWTWLGGSNESNAFGVYASSGTIAALNQPGARRDAVGWIDAQKQLWLFGGYGNAESTTGLLNDLWQLNFNN